MFKFSPKSESIVRTNLNSTLGFFKKKLNANEGQHKKVLQHIKIDGNNDNNLITVINYKMNNNLNGNKNRNTDNNNNSNSNNNQLRERKSMSKPNKLISNFKIINNSSILHKQVSNSNISVIKSDIYQIDTFVQNNKNILRYFQDDLSSILLVKNLRNKIQSVKENLRLPVKSLLEKSDAKSEQTFRHLENLIKSSVNSEELHSNLSQLITENILMKELLGKIEDLFFLFNLKLFDGENDFGDVAQENLSQIVNVKYLCKKVSGGNVNKRGSKGNNNYGNLLRSVDDIPKFKNSMINLSYNSSSKKDGLQNMRKYAPKTEEKLNDSLSFLLEDNNDKKVCNKEEENKKEDDILEGVDADDIKDNKRDVKDKEENYLKGGREKCDGDLMQEIKRISNAINNMKKFSDFINYEEEKVPEIESIFSKLKELFFGYNKEIFKAPLDLILNQLKIKNSYTEKVQAVIKNDINECIENSILMRKIFEEYIEELNKVRKNLKKENSLLEKEKQELKMELEDKKRRLDEIGNRDYRIYYEQMKKDNDFFLAEYKKLRGDNYQRLISEIEKKSEKNNDLKAKIKSLESEIFTMKLDLNTYKKEYKNGNEYADALKEQFEDAAKSFREEIDDLTKEYYIKKEEQAKKMKELEEENNNLKSVQTALMKRLDIIDKLFK